MQDNYQKIYKNMETNSIGSEKRCNKKIIKKNVKLNITLATLVGAIVVSGVVGLKIKNEKEFLSYNEYIQTEEYQEKYGTYGYSQQEIINYAKEKSINLLEENNMTEDGKSSYGFKHYSYTIEDYKKIDKLDESYLLGFYEGTTQSTFNNILMSLGYNSLDDFLLQNNYVDKNGNPDIAEWNLCQYHLIAKNMYESGVNEKVK